MALLLAVLWKEPLTIYFGPGSDFGKVSVPVPFPEPNPEQEPDHYLAVLKKNA
jgi:hypothetical protein